MIEKTMTEGFDPMPDVDELRFLTEGIHVLEDLKTSFLVQCPNATHIKVEKVFDGHTGALVEYRLIPLESKSVVKGSTVRKEGTSGLGLVTGVYGTYCTVQWDWGDWDGNEESIADLQVVTRQMWKMEQDARTKISADILANLVTAEDGLRRLNESFVKFGVNKQ